MRFIPAIFLLAVLAACGSKMDDVVDSANNTIRTFLRDQRIYDRDNMPEETPAVINGYYQIIDGAFRWIVQEDRDGREDELVVQSGDQVSFWFDAREFKGTFDNSTTYFTNKQDRINDIAGSNTEFDARLWPTVPIVLTVGAGEGIIMPAIENCLPGARRGDEVRIFLTPDLWNGSQQSGNIPAFSTLVFQINIESVVKN